MPRQYKTWKGKPRRFTATVLTDQQPGRPVKLLRDGNNSPETFGALYLERVDSTPFHELLLSSLNPV
jgi:hypothetical protein